MKKKSPKSARKVRVRDLTPKKDTKGGGSEKKATKRKTKRKTTKI